jgi:hypothetical protein
MNFNIMIKCFLLFLSFLLTVPVPAQSSLSIPKNIRAAINKGTRTESGAPGNNYWQNNADYTLDVHFDPQTLLLKGNVIIDYVNNSPDTLKQLLFKLYPNLYKQGSPRLMAIDAADITKGVSIEKFSVNAKPVAAEKLRINGTNMTVGIPPLSKGQHVRIDIDYSYTLNKTSHIRTGEIEPGADFIAYFFPRIAVYDDIDGWNRYPYLGNLEFYNDFCHFKASITVPAKQVVWATGNLLNASSVLKPGCVERIKKAESEDGIVIVADSTDITAGVTIQSQATNTWQFEANDVSDFVFACSDHYLWYSSSLVVDKQTGRRTRVDAAFNPKHKDYFQVVNDARKTVESMSYQFPRWPYPYSHETVFDGLDQMEYPMMVNDNPLDDRAESIELTDHEIFHTMFPFYMGINETKYAWMDEGWATIGEWLISPMIDTTLVDLYGIGPVENNAGNETDLPIITLSTETNASYFTNSYPKPAMGYLFAKDYLGDEIFYKGLHYYFTQWHSKHPLPYDFFNSMNKGSGKNLDWFWKKWFFEQGEPNLAIGKPVFSSKQTSIPIIMKGTKPVPIDLIVNYSDGSSDKIHRSVAVWEKGQTSYSVIIPGNKKVKSLSLGSAHVPDSDKKDNTWPVVTANK